MEKLKMQTENLVNTNIDKIANLFPNCISEGTDSNGKVVKMVDFDLLKQELSDIVVEGNDERYTMSWPGKKQAILTANSPINATLRPCREESVDFDKTKNLYIEGDNLDVLKLLRHTYLNKVKMIYIDPPYNTGSDFVYGDDFATSVEEYLKASKSYDEQGNKLFQNNDSNGKFNSDWLSMMYMRLKLAKDLLTDDGVIFISIGEKEQANIKKICDEIFGEFNFITDFIWEKTQHFGRQKLNYYSNADYIYCYAKEKSFANGIYKKLLVEFVNKELGDAPLFNASNSKNQLKFPAGCVKFNIKDGTYTKTTSADYKLLTPVVVENSKNKNEFILEFKSRWSNSTVQDEIKKGTTFWVKTETFAIRAIYGEDKTSTVSPKQILFTNAKNEFCAKDRNGIKINTSENATNDLNDLMDKKCFSYPKPVSLILYFMNLLYDENKNIHHNKFIVLDFFSGSGTTAHATLLANALDKGNRQYVLVQLPENLDINLSKVSKEAREIAENAIELCDELKKKHLLTEIGKERIRRAGKKIKDEYPNAENLDIGFRVLKLDDSCMKDVYYNPENLSQDMLTSLEDNIKEDRSAEDLLFQVMLDMGVMLSSEIKTLDIYGKKVFNVNDGNLICCFDSNLSDEVVTEIAKMKPTYAVFRDNSIANDSICINFEQIFNTYSPTTKRRVL